MNIDWDTWIKHTGQPIVMTIIVAIILLVVGDKVVDRLTRRLIYRTHRTMHRKDIEKRQNTLAGLMTALWRILVISIAVYTIITKLIPDVSLQPLFASAGVIGVAIGFGSQSLVKDFLSGLFIISENQYRVGDVIEIDGFAGTVERIGSRSTVIRDVDGNVHYFPNGIIQHVINKTMGYSMARFTLLIAPEENLDQVIEIINTTGKELAAEDDWKAKIIEAPSYATMTDFTATAITIIVSGKTQPSDQWSVTAEMRRRILAEFDRHHIDLGYIPGMPLATGKKK